MIPNTRVRTPYWEYLSWASIIIVIIILLLSAISSTSILQWRTNQSDFTILKFFPLVLLFIAISLIILAISPYRTVINFIRAITINQFLTLFFILAFTGSFYARVFLNQQTSYFTQALMIVVFFCVAFILLSLPESIWTKTKTSVLYIFGFFGILASVTVIQNVLNNFHDTHSDVAVLLVQAWVLGYLFLKGFKRIIVLFALFFIVGLTFKNTALILLMITVFGTAFLSLKIKWNPRFKKFIPLFFFIGSLIFLSIGAIFYQVTQRFFSDGNTLFRFWIWEQRYKQFLESPIIGKMFTAPTAIFFEPFQLVFTTDNLAPTHNDWLDVMVQGGILGLILFLFAYIWPIIQIFRLRGNQVMANNDAKIAVWAILLLVNVAFAFTFNPFLLNPDISFILWFVAAYSLVLVYRSSQSTSKV